MSRAEFDTRHAKDHTDPEKLLRLSLDLFCTVGGDGQFKHLSGAWEETLGYTIEELTERHYEEFIHPDDRKTTTEELQRALVGESVVTFENRFLSKSGSHKWLAWRVKADLRKGMLYAVARDATELRIAEQTLAARDREILALYKLSEVFRSPRPLGQLYDDILAEICSATGFPVAIIAVADETQKKIIVQATKGMPAEFGSPLLELPIDDTYTGMVVRTGKPLIITRANEHPEHRIAIMEKLGGQTYVGYPMMVGEKIVGSLGLGHTESIEITDHMARWIEWVANYVGALTERKRNEETLRLSHDQLRELSTHLQIAVEEERKRIAREIHDELGQELSLLRLELGLIEGRLRKDQKDLRKGAKSMSKLIVSAIDTVRRVSSDLRPTMLDSLGLGAAVEWHVKEFTRRTKIRCDLSIEPAEMKTDPDRSTALYRVLQEALTNVARHSKATTVKVMLRSSEREIALTVQDNGVGIAPERIADSKSFGLIGIRERVSQLGGSVSVGEARGKGTLVSVTVPQTS